MKKFLMLSCLLIAYSTMYGATIELGSSNIYSETGFETNLRNSVSSPYIIDAKKIEEKKYTSIYEILNDLSVVNGLDMRGQGSTKAKATVQLLVDGVSANFLDTSHIQTPVEMINVKDIERIEIIPGGGAVLYGSGTSGGIINVITKQHKGTYGSVDYQHGSYKENILHVSAGTSAGPVDVNLSYGKNKSSGYRRNYDDSDADFFRGRIRYNINQTDYLSLQYNGYREDFNTPSYLTKEQVKQDRRQSGVSPDVLNSQSKRKKDELTLTYNNQVNDYYTLNLIAFDQKSKMESDSLSLFSRSPRMPKMKMNSSSLFQDEKTGFKLKNKFTYGNENNNSFILGLGYTHNKMLRGQFVTIQLPNGRFQPAANIRLSYHKDTYEVFGIHKIRYGNFEFTQGLRFERAEYEGDRLNSGQKTSLKDHKDNVAGSLAANYLYSDTGNVYVKYERGFTSPAAGQLLNKTVSGTGRAEIATYTYNHLKSEKTNMLELGWNDYLLNSLISGDIYISETSDEIKTIFPNGHGPQFPFYTYNIGKTRRFGFDVRAEQKFDKFTLQEGYSFVHAKIKKDNEKSYEGKYLSYVPTHKFILGIEYAVNDKFSIGIDGQIVSKYYVDDANEYGKHGGKIHFNLRTNYEIMDGLAFYAGINNVFDNEYYENVSYKSELLYNPAAKRNYYAGFRYKF